MTITDLVLAIDGSAPVDMPPRDIGSSTVDQAVQDAESLDGTQAPDVTIALGGNARVSQLSLGVNHTRYSIDEWSPTNQDPAAQASAKLLLQQSSRYQNVRIMGYGVDDPQKQPGGPIDFTSLDIRMDLIIETGGIPVITLAAAPWWMRPTLGGTINTDASYDFKADPNGGWYFENYAPDPSHFQAFADLARAVALRYAKPPYNCRRFQIWHELKGFYDSATQSWNASAYVDFYNTVRQALYDTVDEQGMPIGHELRVGGPYKGMSSRNPGSIADCSAITGPYGCVRQSVLDVVTYWRDHAIVFPGDFLVMDSGIMDTAFSARGHDAVFGWSTKIADLTEWVNVVKGQANNLTSPSANIILAQMPVWWSEWYVTPYSYSDPTYGMPAFDHDHQNALMAVALIKMVKAGVDVALRWSPQGDTNHPNYQGDYESIWSDVRQVGGGQPFPFFNTAKVLHVEFGPGTSLVAATPSSADIEVLASPTKALLVNQSSQTSHRVGIGSAVVLLAPHTVELVAY